MNLATLLTQKVTPMKLWTSPKEECVKRNSDSMRKLNTKAKKEKAFSLLTKPMTPKELATLTDFTEETCYRYLCELTREQRVKRSMKIPYIYWKR